MRVVYVAALCSSLVSVLAKEADRRPLRQPLHPGQHVARTPVALVLVQHDPVLHEPQLRRRPDGRDVRLLGPRDDLANPTLVAPVPQRLAASLGREAVVGVFLPQTPAHVGREGRRALRERDHPDHFAVGGSGKRGGGVGSTCGGRRVEGFLVRFQTHDVAGGCGALVEYLRTCGRLDERAGPETVDLVAGREAVVAEVREEGRVVHHAQVELEVRGVRDVVEDEVEAGGFESACEPRKGLRGHSCCYCCPVLLRWK